MFVNFTGTRRIRRLGIDGEFGTVYCPNNCGQTFKNIGNANRHLRYVCGKPPMFKCTICSKPFSRKDNLKAHIITKHRLLNFHD